MRARGALDPSGLVKGWSGFDAFNYSFLSVNLVTLGMFYSLAVFAYVPDGSVLSVSVRATACSTLRPPDVTLASLSSSAFTEVETP